MTFEHERMPTPLDDLCESWVKTLLELQPEYYVYLGRPGGEGRYSDLSPDGHAEIARATTEALAHARALAPVDATDQVTQAELIREFENSLQRHELGWWQRDLNVIASPVQDLRDIFDLMPDESDDDWEAIDARLHHVPEAISGYIASLRAGIAAGNVPAIRQVREAVLQARQQATGAFFATLPATAAQQERPSTLVTRLRSGAAVAQEAYAELAEFLDSELAPAAPSADGVGRELYSVMSSWFIGADIDLDETYAWGIDELARMVAEQEAVAQQIVPGATVTEAIAHLEQGSRLHGTDELQRWMQATSDQAIAALDGVHFDIPAPLHRLECRIAPTATGGIYYTGPSEDFARPGRMWWSVPAGDTEFDTWRERTTVYHEGVPGHHLQVGLATYNRAELNTWRRNQFISGHGEGWALYAERLMDQLGFLDDPADRLGMLDAQRMRAARVVLDLGVHLGLPKPDGSGPWTGDDAFAFMPQHAAMSEATIRFEVNRYLGWPGQAPSYKVGQRLWEQLRDDWFALHGNDPKEFHRRALSVGAVGLQTLRNHLLSASLDS